MRSGKALRWVLIAAAIFYSTIFAAMNAVQIFEYEDNDQFRVIDREGEPWFVLTEVCKKIGIANPRDAASRLDDDEKDGVGISDAMGREQKHWAFSQNMAEAMQRAGAGGTRQPA